MAKKKIQKKGIVPFPKKFYVCRFPEKSFGTGPNVPASRELYAYEHIDNVPEDAVVIEIDLVEKTASRGKVTNEILFVHDEA